MKFTAEISHWRQLSIVSLLAFALAGCAVPTATISRPDAYYNDALYSNVDSEQAGDSLFSGDADVLSDEAINTILNYKYAPPALNRVALMPFGREVWSRWSEELALASEQMKSDVTDRLRASPKVYDASYLPSILIPENRTVPHLREAAARYQFSRNDA